MPQIIQVAAFQALGVIATALITTSLFGGESIAVSNAITLQLQSGRRFTGEIDGRSTAQSLYLRTTSLGSVLLRPIDWEQITSAVQGETKLTVNELKAMRSRLAADSRASVIPITVAGSTEVPQIPAPLRRPMTWQPSGPPPYFDPVVRSLQIEATLANWNADAELDGVLLTVSPIAGDGAVLPVYGTLAVELSARLAASHWTTDPPVTIDRWNQVLWPDQVGPLGAYYRLPFSHFRPEGQAAYGPGVTRLFGTVNVRLNVPGHNTVEATTTLRIRR